MRSEEAGRSIYQKAGIIYRISVFSEAAVKI